MKVQKTSNSLNTGQKEQMLMISQYLIATDMSINGAEQRNQQGNHIAIHFILGKAVENLHWKKDSLVSKCCRENCMSTHRSLKLDLTLTLGKDQFKIDLRL